MKGVHHVGLICKDLQASMRFYVDTLGAAITQPLCMCRGLSTLMTRVMHSPKLSFACAQSRAWWPPSCNWIATIRARYPDPALASAAIASTGCVIESGESRLGLTERSDRPNDKLPYGGAWLDLGTEMVHLMEVPNPDEGMLRPEHGGRDRHFCVGVGEGGVAELRETLDAAGAPCTWLSSSGGADASALRLGVRHSARRRQATAWIKGACSVCTSGGCHSGRRG